jgi:hypothetical protein
LDIQNEVARSAALVACPEGQALAMLLGEFWASYVIMGVIEMPQKWFARAEGDRRGLLTAMWRIDVKPL